MSRAWPIPWLELGCLGPLRIRTERFAWGIEHPLRLMYASDLHLGHWWTRPLVLQLREAVEKVRPDHLVLGGDLVDTAAALPRLEECLRGLGRHTTVHALAGNHDTCVGHDALKQAVLGAGASWLPDQPIREPIVIFGGLESRPEGPAVLCTHYPSVFPRAVAAGFRLVLAGHLHGGQCVLLTRRERLYPGAWIDGWHGLRFEMEEATMLVSRGAADTLPIRWNCPREVLVCEFI